MHNLEVLEGRCACCGFSEVLADVCLTPQDYVPESEQADQMPDVDRWDKYLSKIHAR